VEEGNKAGIILSSEAAQQDSVNRAVGEPRSTSTMVSLMLSLSYCSISLVRKAAQLGDAMCAIHKKLQRQDGHSSWLQCCRVAVLVLLCCIHTGTHAEDLPNVTQQVLHRGCLLCVKWHSCVFQQCGLLNIR
jgi:hypothetical protein